MRLLCPIIALAISIMTLVFVIWSDRNLDRKFTKTQENYKKNKRERISKRR